MRNQLVQRVPRSIGPSVKDLRVVKHVHQRLDILIVDFKITQKRYEDECRCGCVEDRSVGGLLGALGQCVRTVVAAHVFHNNVDAAIGTANESGSDPVMDADFSIVLASQTFSSLRTSCVFAVWKVPPSSDLAMSR